MDLSNSILGASLLLSLVTIVSLTRYIIIWRNDIQKTYLRLSKLEEKVRRIPEECPIKQQLEGMIRQRPALQEKKPDSIEFVRQYIHFHHPALIDDIARHTGEKPSNTDELLCMMIKLKYTNKEIGSILSITNSSVLTARYRLKRKLGLPQQEQLDTWIQGVGQKEPYQ